MFNAPLVRADGAGLLIHQLPELSGARWREIVLDFHYFTGRDVQLAMSGRARATGAHASGARQPRRPWG